MLIGFTLSNQIEGSLLLTASCYEDQPSLTLLSMSCSSGVQFWAQMPKSININAKRIIFLIMLEFW